MLSLTENANRYVCENTACGFEKYLNEYVRFVLKCWANIGWHIYDWANTTRDENFRMCLKYESRDRENVIVCEKYGHPSLWLVNVPLINFNQIFGSIYDDNAHP